MIELSQLGTYSLYGMDISETFVGMARENARLAGVEVEFRQGNASRMPHNDSLFDRIVNRAAFKNFRDPVGALREMYRVLKPEGRVLIQGIRPDITMKTVNPYVDNMRLGWFQSLSTMFVFRFVLRRLAHLKQEFEEFLAQTEFTKYSISEESRLGYEIVLQK